LRKQAPLRSCGFSSHSRLAPIRSSIFAPLLYHMTFCRLLPDLPKHEPASHADGSIGPGVVARNRPATTLELGPNHIKRIPKALVWYGTATHALF
jgi:hypothetical protein